MARIHQNRALSSLLCNCGSTRSYLNTVALGYYGIPYKDISEYSIVKGICLRRVNASGLAFKYANCYLRCWSVVFYTTLNYNPLNSQRNTTAFASLPLPEVYPTTYTSVSSLRLYLSVVLLLFALTENTYSLSTPRNTAPSYPSYIYLSINSSALSEDSINPVSTIQSLGNTCLSSARRLAKPEFGLDTNPKSKTRNYISLVSLLSFLIILFNCYRLDPCLYNSPSKNTQSSTSVLTMNSRIYAFMCCKLVYSHWPRLQRHTPPLLLATATHRNPSYLRCI